MMSDPIDMFFASQDEFFALALAGEFDGMSDAEVRAMVGECVRFYKLDHLEKHLTDKTVECLALLRAHPECCCPKHRKIRKARK